VAAYRALIVEDTPEEAERLKAHLSRYASEHEDLSFSCQILGSALEFLEKRPAADIVFMDIAMPGINGMEAAEAMREKDPETPLIFVTDLAQYAVKGYQVDALDFMVKPVSYDDFSLRMGRAMRVLARRQGRTITISTTEGTCIVELSELLYVETYRHDVLYHLASGEVLRNRNSLASLERELAPQDFVRIAASHLVNMAQVTRVRKDSVVMTNGDELFFGRTRRKEALERLGAYIGGTI
jgi:DNA-binding LytR/AlgR family response regulator